MIQDELYARVLRALMVHANVDRMTENGLLHSDVATENTDVTSGLDRFSSRVVRSATKMVPVYTTYFAFENTVREFVAEAMQDAHGDSWWDRVPQKLRTSVETRKKQLGKHKWYTYQPPSNVSQLMFGDLASIMTDQWSLFDTFFPSQDWVRVRLNELEMSRNVIAHANELPDEEIERLNGYLNDWFRQVPS